MLKSRRVQKWQQWAIYYEVLRLLYLTQSKRLTGTISIDMWTDYSGLRPERFLSDFDPASEEPWRR